MVYASYTGFSSEFTKFPIEIYTTDELCDEIISRIQQEDFKVTAKMDLLGKIISTKSLQQICKKFGESLNEKA